MISKKVQQKGTVKKELTKNDEEFCLRSESKSERLLGEQKNAKRRVEEETNLNSSYKDFSKIEYESFTDEMKTIRIRKFELQEDNKILKQKQKDLESEVKTKILKFAEYKSKQTKADKHLRKLKILHRKEINKLQKKFEKLLDIVQEEKVVQIDEIRREYEQQIKFMKIDIDDLMVALEERDTRLFKMILDKGNDNFLEEQVNTMTIELERKNAQLSQITGAVKEGRSFVRQIEEESQKILQENKLLKEQMNHNSKPRLVSAFDHANNTRIGKFLLPDKFKINFKNVN